MLRSLLVPILHERFPNRGLVEGSPPDACAVFPGIHSGIRSLSIYDDGDELTVSVDDLTHSHFAEYSDVPKAEGERRIVAAVVEFLEKLFADKVVVWGRHNRGGGWYELSTDSGDSCRDVAEFVWSGPRRSSGSLT